VVSVEPAACIIGPTACTIGCDLARNSTDERILVMKVAIFGDIAPCSPRRNRRFGGTYYLHLQS
jgi:hypothetical protein